jgi:hypothetical protein
MGRKRKVSHVSVSVEDSEAASSAVQGRRISGSTKANYQSKVVQLTDWYQIEHPSQIENGVLVLPLPEDTVIRFFTHKCMPAFNRMSLQSKKDLTEATLAEPFAPTTLTGYRSALVDLYRSKKLKLSDDLERELKALLSGYEKICNDLKKKGLMKLNPGKRELRRDGYILLCRKLMTYKPINRHGSWSTSVFSWCFFTMLWNLISRPESIETITLNMITWKEDCLTVDEHVSCSYCPPQVAE